MEQRGDLVDVGDGANDPHGTVAAPADGDIDGEHAREKRCPPDAGLRARLRQRGPRLPRAQGYTLCDLGEYPAIIEGGSSSVVGELYEVDEPTLRAIDELEGHPDFYRRVPLTLTRVDGAQGYVLRKRGADRCPPITSGDWREHRRRIVLAAGRTTPPVDG